MRSEAKAGQADGPPPKRLQKVVCQLAKKKSGLVMAMSTNEAPTQVAICIFDGAPHSSDFLATTFQTPRRRVTHQPRSPGAK